jgi:hypothetical protein
MQSLSNLVDKIGLLIDKVNTLQGAASPTGLIPIK